MDRMDLPALLALLRANGVTKYCSPEGMLIELGATPAAAAKPKEQEAQPPRDAADVALEMRGMSGPYQDDAP